VISTSPAFTEEIYKRNVSDGLSISDIEKDLKITKQSIQEIRRDQINYRIEKEILKEMYSSEINTINIIIAMILGLFTIIGYIGVKSVGSIKDEFRKELDDLIGLKTKYEKKFDEMDRFHHDSKNELETIKIVSEDQSKRLKILEVQEKTGSLISNQHYSRALEYLYAGLTIDENDTVLLNQKAHCLMMLRRFQEAIDVFKKLRQLEPKAINHIVNLIEAYLLIRRADLYGEAIKKYSDQIMEKYPQKLIWYYELIRLYIEADETSMRNHILNGTSKSDNEKKEHIGKWVFHEIENAFSDDPPSENKKMLFNAIEYFDAKISGSELREAINA